MYWNCEIETLTTDNLKGLQLERLRRTVARAGQSQFYGQRLEQAGIVPDDLGSLEDIRMLPFTTKDDLRTSSLQMLTTPLKEIIRLHASSGTTGQATVIYYTRTDIELWADLVARSLYMTGMRQEDVFQNMMGYGLFTGGLGFHYGAERLGALTIPAGAGNSKRQVQLMRQFNVTAIHIIPSYALFLLQTFEELGVDPRDLPLRLAYIGAEPYSDATRRRIEAAYGVKAYNCYGLSELNGPGVAFECPEQNGSHVWEDSYLIEVLDPSTLDPVPPGTVGELVFTNLTRQGMPLLRYRSRDLASYDDRPCPCGRSSRRISRIQGRTDDMIILKGVNIFPIQIDRVLMRLPEVASNYLIEMQQTGGNDQMVIKVEVKQEYFSEDLAYLKGLQKRITEALKSELLVTPRVDLVEHNSLPRTEGKAVRVVDSRPKA
ncbi:phenylacetate--CoA ligase family protein [Desulfobacca acetoxidans]|uniref:Phenylacetate-coenzyme A ligase n=1 Tax=Desulfobacca acetoxidans (strain ATCC 700848 / DSM 11109 / ASRB2) TaxID=880072 RepID=F2NHD2_DESAR|nr:phenylacetate--CoA ligase [Desulfobacca acetoxidans]AEB09048.1 Phenylacetate--CoA ligase [Desulfobacca acetoxidans DSM 11109]